jgi:WD40 repeat protein
LGAPREVLRERGASIDSVAFSHDGQRLAVALHDGTVRVLGSNGNGSIQILRGHVGPVLGVDINTDGSQVVSAGQDGTIRLWDPGAGKDRTLYRGSEPENSVRFSPDGSLILAVGSDGWMRLWNSRTMTLARRQPVSTRELLAAAFSPDGREYAVSGKDGVIRVWTVVGGPPLAEIAGQLSRVLDLGFGTADRLVSAGADGTARIWNVQHTQSWIEPGQPKAVDFSPDGRYLAAVGADGAVRVTDAATGRLRMSLPGPTGYASALFSPNGNALVIGHDPPSRITIWQLSTNRQSLVAQLPKKRGLNIARFDSTGSRVVYADNAGAIGVLDLRSRRAVRLGGLHGVAWDAAFAPDDEHVAAATATGKVLIWRLDHPSTPERVLTGHRGDINTLDYSADGRIVTSGYDRTVRVWNPSKGTEVILRGNGDEITGAVFAPGGQQVLTSSDDGTVRLWSASSGAELAVLQTGDVPLWDVEVSRDGQIATLSRTGQVRVFRCGVCGSLGQVRRLGSSLVGNR